MAESDEVALELIDAQSRLSGYIYSLVLNHELTKDILQRTNVVLLEKREKYEPGTNFFAWACRVAYHEVLACRRDRQREKLIFDDQLLPILAVASEQRFDRQDDQMQALFDCLSQLPVDQQRLIKDRYSPGGSVARLSTALRKSPSAISSLLSRIRIRLAACVDKKMKGQLAQ